MADRSIRIERLRVRLTGAPVEVGTDLSGTLGAALVARLGPELAGARPTRASIHRLDVAVGPGPSPLEARVADAVAGAVGQRLPGRGNRP
jgi:hypothetical protein